MAKIFVEFKEDSPDGVLELSAYALSPAQHEEAMRELDDQQAIKDEEEYLAKVEYTYIDADSFRAVFRGEYHYMADTVMKELKAVGWRWNE